MDWNEKFSIFLTENRHQQDLDDAALATNDPAIIAARAKEAFEWHRTNPYSARNFGLKEMANELARQLYGKPFDEMTPKE